MTVEQRIMLMAGIMVIQNMLLVLIFVFPQSWYILLIGWWIEAGLFWYQFSKLRKR